jgi:hypothetical protein
MVVSNTYCVVFVLIIAEVVGIFPKSNRKIEETCKIDTP